MIFDNLKNKALYESVHPKFGEAFAFIERAVAEGCCKERKRPI